MHVYLIERTGKHSRDEYDSAVVIAANQEDARNTHPDANIAPRTRWWEDDEDGNPQDYSNWPNPAKIRVTLLGPSLSNLPRVVCASFNPS